MKSTVWKLLGFDAREDEEDGKKTPIPTEVREVILLRPEIELPFSVDVHIWPSQFLYYPHFHKVARKPPLIEVHRDSGSDFWLNLTQMRKLLTKNGRTAILIAVELLAPESLASSDFPSPNTYSATEPNDVPDGSICLGFDVADSGFLSGLSNCGYSEEDRARLRPEWQSRINDFGLITSEQDAFRFKEITNTRVPEHAPFGVYRLHRLADLS
jgi:hypothetical protein